MANHEPTNMANHEPTNMANHEPTIMANQNNQKFGAKMQSREWNQNSLFLLMKKTRAKKFKVRMFYHLQNLFWGAFVWGVLAWGVYVWGFLS